MSLRIGDYEVIENFSNVVHEFRERDVITDNSTPSDVRWRDLQSAMSATIICAIPQQWWRDVEAALARWELELKYRATHRAHRGRRRHVKRWIAQQSTDGVRGVRKWDYRSDAPNVVRVVKEEK